MGGQSGRACARDQLQQQQQQQQQLQLQQQQQQLQQQREQQQELLQQYFICPCGLRLKCSDAVTHEADPGHVRWLAIIAGLASSIEEPQELDTAVNHRHHRHRHRRHGRI